MSAKTPGYSVNHHKLGPGDLWHTPGLQLPAYIQNVAKGLMESGRDRSSAIRMAVGVIKRWAAGGGNVHPEVRAASRKALAEWEAAKAKAHATSHTQESSVSAPLALAGPWDPSKHPRNAAGSAGGGKFAPARNAQAAEAQKDKGAQANYGKTLGALDADAQLKGMSDDELQKLSMAAYSFKSSDPKVVALRIKIANQLRARGKDVNDYGGLGKPSKPAPSKTASKATKRKLTSRKAPAKANPTSAQRSTHLAHELSLASPNTTSGDGPPVTMPDGSFPIPDKRHLRKAVQAIGRAHPSKRPAVRAHIRRRARHLGVPIPNGATKKGQ